jgi:hypothetical protein
LIYFEENKLSPKLWAKRMGIGRVVFRLVEQWIVGRLEWKGGGMEYWTHRPSGVSLLLTPRYWIDGMLEK